MLIRVSKLPTVRSRKQKRPTFGVLFYAAAEQIFSDTEAQKRQRRFTKFSVCIPTFSLRCQIDWCTFISLPHFLMASRHTSPHDLTDEIFTAQDFDACLPDSTSKAESNHESATDRLTRLLSVAQQKAARTFSASSRRRGFAASAAGIVSHHAEKLAVRQMLTALPQAEHLLHNLEFSEEQQADVFVGHNLSTTTDDNGQPAVVFNKANSDRLEFKEELDLSGSVTVSSKFKLNSKQGIQTLPSQYDVTPDGRGFLFQARTDINKIYLYTSNKHHQVDYSFEVGEWYETTFTFDNNSGLITFFVNGAAVGTTQDSSNAIRPANAKSFMGGWGSDGQHDGFDGAIGSTRIWDTNLTADEVQAAYNYVPAADVPAEADAPVIDLEAAKAAALAPSTVPVAPAIETEVVEAGEPTIETIIPTAQLQHSKSKWSGGLAHQDGDTYVLGNADQFISSQQYLATPENPVHFQGTVRFTSDEVAYFNLRTQGNSNAFQGYRFNDQIQVEILRYNSLQRFSIRTYNNGSITNLVTTPVPMALNTDYRIALVDAGASVTLTITDLDGNELANHTQAVSQPTSPGGGSLGSYFHEGDKRATVRQVQFGPTEQVITEAEPIVTTVLTEPEAGAYQSTGTTTPLASHEVAAPKTKEVISLVENAMPTVEAPVSLTGSLEFSGSDNLFLNVYRTTGDLAYQLQVRPGDQALVVRSATSEVDRFDLPVPYNQDLNFTFSTDGDELLMVFTDSEDAEVLRTSLPDANLNEGFSIEVRNDARAKRVTEWGGRQVDYPQGFVKLSNVEARQWVGSPEGMLPYTPLSTLLTMPTESAINLKLDEMQQASAAVLARTNAMQAMDMAELTAEETNQAFEALSAESNLVDQHQADWDALVLATQHHPGIDAIIVNCLESIDTAQGQYIDIPLDTLGGTARLQSWKTDREAANLTMEDDHTDFVSTGQVLSLDLSSSDSFTKGATFQVLSSTNENITVDFYRGENLLSSQDVASGDTVTFSDAEGMTGIIITNPSNDPASTVTIDNITFDGTVNRNQLDVQQMDALQHRDLALAAAPDFNGDLTNEEYAAARAAANIGHANESGSAYPAPSLVDDNYHILRDLPGGHSSSGISLSYINGDGQRVPLSSDFARYVEGSGFVISPALQGTELFWNLPSLKDGSSYFQNVRVPNFANAVPNYDEMNLSITGTGRVAYGSAIPLGVQADRYELNDVKRIAGSFIAITTINNANAATGSATIVMSTGVDGNFSEQARYDVEVPAYGNVYVNIPIQFPGDADGLGKYRIEAIVDGETTLLQEAGFVDFNNSKGVIGGVSSGSGSTRITNADSDELAGVFNTAKREAASAKTMAELGLSRVSQEVLMEMQEDFGGYVDTDSGLALDVVAWQGLSVEEQTTVFGDFTKEQQVRYYQASHTDTKGNVSHLLTGGQKKQIREASIQQALDKATSPVVRSILKARAQAGETGEAVPDPRYGLLEVREDKGEQTVVAINEDTGEEIVIGVGNSEERTEWINGVLSAESKAMGISTEKALIHSQLRELWGIHRQLEEAKTDLHNEISKIDASITSAAKEAAALNIITTWWGNFSQSIATSSVSLPAFVSAPAIGALSAANIDGTVPDNSSIYTDSVALGITYAFGKAAGAPYTIAVAVGSLVGKNVAATTEVYVAHTYLNAQGNIQARSISLNDAIADRQQRLLELSE